MILPRCFSLALRSIAIAALLTVSSPAHATSMSSNTVDFFLTLASATYQDDGTDADVEVFGYQDEVLGTFEAGTATQSGSSSFTVDGNPPADPEDFELPVGSTIEATIVAETSADGLGSQATHIRDLIFELYVDVVDGDGTRNILLDFDWSYTRSFSMTNMVAGDQSAVFLEADVAITNYESYDDAFFFVENENYGNSMATTFALSPSDSGSFELLMDVEFGGATSSVVTVTLEVGANNIINVPEPSHAALLSLSLLSLGTLAGVRRR